MHEFHKGWNQIKKYHLLWIFENKSIQIQILQNTGRWSKQTEDN